jgi:hypothetical protein
MPSPSGAISGGTVRCEATTHGAGVRAEDPEVAQQDDGGGLSQVGKLLRGPLMVVIPLMALVMVAGIGIPIGLLFIQMHNSFSENVTLIVAVALTATVMAIAGLLSYQDYKNPRRPATPQPRKGRPAGGESQAGPRAAVTERPARGRSRSDGRRKSR